MCRGELDKQGNPHGLKKVIDSLANGAKGAIEMAGTCAAAGIVIGIISQTGIGLKFATILLEFSQGILPLALGLSMVVAIILGMGMPTTAAYAICAAVITTGLIKLGAIPIAAHLFVFYFACISAITPPVALAAYAGAAIAKASPKGRLYRYEARRGSLHRALHVHLQPCHASYRKPFRHCYWPLLHPCSAHSPWRAACKGGSSAGRYLLPSECLSSQGLYCLSSRGFTPTSSVSVSL